MSAKNRIARRFAQLADERRGGLITFITAGDPDAPTSMEIFKRLPAAGADLIELGVPFSDPMADGPAIQASSQRALHAGQTLERTLEMVANFRRSDADTPLVFMGYYNPIYVYGVEAFVDHAKRADVDGLIVVDLPPEECDELLKPAWAAGIDLIFLVAPTTDDERLPLVLNRARGFVYYVSIAGITGTASAAAASVKGAVARIRRHTNLPVAVGFGIKTPEQAATMANIADAVVVGSALVAKVAEHVDENGARRQGLVEAIEGFVGELARSVRTARIKGAAE